MQNFDKQSAEKRKNEIAADLIRELPTGLLRWYPFDRGKDALYIGSADDAIYKMLKEDKGLKAETAALHGICEISSNIQYSYIVCVAELERSYTPGKVLSELRSHLKDDGILLLGMNNRLGIRYFIGDRDPYTERNFDSIEDYWRAYNKAEDAFNGRMYAKDEIAAFLDESGYPVKKFYSVLTDLNNPAFLYADGYLPNEDLSNRVFPTYNAPDTVFLDELPLYKTLTANGLFHKMANAWLIECTSGGKLSDALHVTSSIERGRKDALITIIHSNDTVTKEAAYPEGKKRIENLFINAQKLKDRGIKVIPSKLEGDKCTMPLVKGVNGQLYLRELLEKDKDQFFEAMDHFRDIIVSSSKVHEGIYEPEPDPDPDQEKKKARIRHMDGEDTPTLLLDEAMFDLVPLNSFYVDGDFCFYDQEFCLNNYPLNVLILRMIATFYSGSPELYKLLPADDLYERYGLKDELIRWQRPEWEFLSKLRKQNELADYHNKVWADSGIINENRQRLNFSAEDFQRLFIDIFEYADTRKLILFGSGLFAKHFIELYAQDYPVYAVIDNNEKRQGQELQGLDGVKIQSPDILRQMKHGEYKVLICIKNYLSVMKQLEEMGIKEYSVYDMGRAYPRKRHPIPKADDTKKKYHVGYIAGVFDLYHIGHLNMFRRAKEKCDYLIVGVVTDEGVKRFKGTDPFVPFEERIEMVRSCRYVDEAVEIPLMFADTKKAWELHHFDVQFSGSDYINDPGWLKQKDFLEKHGATLEFFPYTQATSSTKLKKLIDEKILMFENYPGKGEEDV